MAENENAAFKFELSHPITAHGKPLHEITFRKPTGGDIARFGNPVKYNPFDLEGEVDFYTDRMTAQLAHLADVNPAAIAQMDPNDWYSCAWGIAGFFIPRVRKPTSTQPSTSGS